MEIPKEINTDKLTCRLEFELGNKIDDVYFQIITGVEFLYGETGTQIMSLKLQSVFNVLGLDSVRKIEDNNVNYSSDFIKSILNITVGALRGMVVSKVIGTGLSAFPIPLIDLSQFVKDNNLK